MTAGRGHFINGAWTPGTGVKFISTDPATGEEVWSGAEAQLFEVTAAIEAARKAFDAWSGLDTAKRADYLRAYASAIKEDSGAISETISRETGKPLWESRQEIQSMVAKVDNSIEACKDRNAPVTTNQGPLRAVKRYKPHGVVAVLGPFNLPGHLPHSHIVPALLAGNTVVYKPSEMTPGVAEKTTEAWRKAGLPAGVLNLVQGARATGGALATHAGIDGLFFTGSHAAGLALNRGFAETPGKILALEMGGNNPLVIWTCADAAAAALLIAQSAFITSGQRCTCARRLIIPQGKPGQVFLDALIALLPRLRVGAWNDQPEPFLGPVISAAAATRLLEAQTNLERMRGKILVPMRKLERSPAFLTPGIMDVTAVPNRPDEEYFGPLLQVYRAASFDAALAEANNTRFGLAAGLISDDAAAWDIFQKRIRAGVVNRNRQTTGASGELPFGGVGDSGNHRPSAYFAADYCAYPIASLESDKPPAPAPQPGIEPAKA